MNVIALNNIRYILTSFAVVLSLTVTAQAPKADCDADRRYNYFFLEAVCQQEKGNYGAAFDLLRHALEIKPDASEAYFLLSGYYVDLKNDSLARVCFEKAAELSPQNSTYKERLGQFYISQRELDKAVEVYESLYADNPVREDVLELLYRMYSASNNYEQAINALERMELIEGANRHLTLMKMQVYDQIGDKAKVQKELQSLVDKNPDELDYRVMLGNWLLQNDKAKAALKEFTAVLKEEPGNEAAQMSMLDYYNAKDMKDKAEELCEKLLLSPSTEMDTKTTLMRNLISDTEDAGGDSLKVFAMFDKVLALPQKSGDMLMLKAAYMSMKSMPDDSTAAVYRQVLDVEPDNVGARYQVIKSLWGKEEYDKVIEICRPAQEYNPDEMVFYYFEGLAHYQKGDNDGALDAFRRGVGQIKSDENKEFASDFYAIMGDILHTKGLDGEAFEAYDKSLEYNADNVSVLNNYAYYLSLLGKDMERAERMSYKAIKAEPENGTYLDTYAWILFLQGRYEEARIYMDQTLKDESALSADVYEHAGDIYANTDDIDKAVECWKLAEEKGGEGETLKKKIEKRRYLKE